MNTSYFGLNGGHHGTQQQQQQQQQYYSSAPMRVSDPSAIPIAMGSIRQTPLAQASPTASSTFEEESEQNSIEEQALGPNDVLSGRSKLSFNHSTFPTVKECCQSQQNLILLSIRLCLTFLLCWICLIFLDFAHVPNCV